MNRRNFVLPTNEAYTEFYEQTSAMTNMDFDIAEITLSILYALSNENRGAGLSRLYSLHINHGSSTHPRDGELLANAIVHLATDIGTLITNMGWRFMEGYVWMGELCLCYDSYLNGNMVLVPVGSI